MYISKFIAVLGRIGLSFGSLNVPDKGAVDNGSYRLDHRLEKIEKEDGTFLKAGSCYVDYQLALLPKLVFSGHLSPDNNSVGFQIHSFSFKYKEHKKGDNFVFACEPCPYASVSISIDREPLSGEGYKVHPGFTGKFYLGSSNISVGWGDSWRCSGTLNAEWCMGIYRTSWTGNADLEKRSVDNAITLRTDAHSLRIEHSGFKQFAWEYSYTREGFPDLVTSIKWVHEKHRELRIGYSVKFSPKK
ncbi:hypothetical protein MLD38_013901 [Melastoma candidum]|uniref:Uncharacterized protein n=1 Tax=Melastoma candidum TaxID=119954 RepID=A0ACB9RB68_9MYRT|nr:hypothetical protein MLD38_013901 [Melastoma candidum]